MENTVLKTELTDAEMQDLELERYQKVGALLHHPGCDGKSRNNLYQNR